MSASIYSNQTSALAVGQRHGKAVVLTIRAAEMQQDGYIFYLSENQVWLSQSVPAQYIEFV
jgi:putative RNA 2'-phosphotransferase